MKQSIGLLSIVLLAIGLAGCGGQGTSLSSGGRSTARDAVREALTSGSSARTMRGSREVRLGPTPSNAALSSRDGGDGSDGDGGGSDIIRYNVGDPYPVSSDLFGRVVAFATDFYQGTEYVSRLDYDIFADAEFTREAGFSRFSTLRTDALLETRAETVFTDAAPSPSRSLSYYRIDLQTGATIFEFAKSGRNDDADSFLYEASVRWTSEGSGQGGSYAYEFKRNGTVTVQASGTYRADGGFDVSWLNERGYTVAMSFAPDGSGTFSVTNANDPLCPAAGSFDEMGIGTVRFADGTTEPFDLNAEQFWQ